MKFRLPDLPSARRFRRLCIAFFGRKNWPIPRLEYSKQGDPGAMERGHFGNPGAFLLGVIELGGGVRPGSPFSAAPESQAGAWLS
jgi:hypothetical protein